MTIKLKSTRQLEVSQLVDTVLALSADDAFTIHGIEFYDDCIFDTIDGTEYPSLTEWATIQVEVMYGTKFEKRQHHKNYEE